MTVRLATPAQSTCASGAAGASSTSSLTPAQRAEAVVEAWTPEEREIDTEVKRCATCHVPTNLRVKGKAMCYDCHFKRYRESFYVLFDNALPE